MNVSHGSNVALTESPTAIVDYIFRVLGMEYLGQTDFVHVKPDNNQELAIHRGVTQAIQMDMSSAMVEQKAIAEVKRNAVESATGDSTSTSTTASVLSAHLQKMMGDAPFCSSCGHTTVRNGACYKCLNCGTSMGCS